MKTLDDYRKEVLQDYLNKKNADQLHNNLVYPTPAKIRNECLRVCESRFLARDVKVISDNFTVQADKDAYCLAIKKTVADKMRPMESWLKGKTIPQEESMVELLAWLINFEPRPYKFDPYNTTEAQPLQADATLKNVEMPTTETLPRQTENWQEPEPNNAYQDSPAEARPLQPNTTPLYQENIQLELPAKPTAIMQKRMVINWKKWTPWLAILLIACVCIYFTTRSRSRANQQCMYWAGDHYQPAACNEKIEGLVPLDSEKLTNFKKIGLKALNHQSLGKTWYVKINGVIEFYTDSGFHPTQPGKRLLPVTSYILNNYSKSYNTTEGHVNYPDQAKNGLKYAKAPRYIDVFLNINANDKVLINGEAATADEISDKPNTLKLVFGKHYRIKINNCPEQDIIAMENTTLSVCM